MICGDCDEFDCQYLRAPFYIVESNSTIVVRIRPKTFGSRATYPSKNSLGKRVGVRGIYSRLLPVFFYLNL